jgi:hypothetical protein
MKLTPVMQDKCLFTGLFFATSTTTSPLYVRDIECRVLGINWRCPSRPYWVHGRLNKHTHAHWWLASADELTVLVDEDKEDDQ